MKMSFYHKSLSDFTKPGMIKISNETFLYRLFVNQYAFDPDNADEVLARWKDKVIEILSESDLCIADWADLGDLCHPLIIALGIGKACNTC